MTATQPAGVTHDDTPYPPQPQPPEPHRYAELIATTPARLAATKPLLAQTLAAVGDTNQLGDDFYRRLLNRHPQLRPLFTNLELQRKRLIDAVKAMAANVDNLSALMPVLEGMGRGHARFDRAPGFGGIQPVHFDIVGGILLEVLAEHAATVWTAEHARAWKLVYDFAAGVMLANIHHVRARRAA